MNNHEFDQIVKKYKKLIYAVAYKFINDKHEVENIAQDSFLAFYKNYDRYKNEDIKNILCKIAINKCKDYLAKKVEHEDVDELYDMESNIDVIRTVERTETQKEVHECINSLSTTYKETIIKYYIEEKSLEEVAEEMNVSKNVLKVQLTRAKKKLKKLLQERGISYD